MQQAIGWNRRGLFRTLACGCLAAGMPGRLWASDGPKTSLSPDQALQSLKQGNQEFADDHPHSLALNRERRQQISPAQSPFAVVVGCSDSRVPPELVFTRGLGE